MEGRIVILSDLHLGRPRCAAGSPEALRPLWRGAAHLVVNGDTAEVHHPGHWSEAARQTIRLFDLCEADEVELTLLSGNHDPYLSDLRHLHLADDRIFVTHGDALHPAVAPWSPAVARLRRAHAAALAALDPEERDQLEARLRASQHASFAEWSEIHRLAEEARRSTVRGMLVRPIAVVRVLHYWRIFPGLAADFARRHAPAARFVVVGHTHRAGAWRIADRVVLNTGSFGFPGRPHAIVIDDGRIALHAIRRAGDVFALVPEPRASYDL